jgi:hypothetical protein
MVVLTFIHAKEDNRQSMIIPFNYCCLFQLVSAIKVLIAHVMLIFHLLTWLKIAEQLNKSITALISLSHMHHDSVKRNHMRIDK